MWELKPTQKYSRNVDMNHISTHKFVYKVSPVHLENSKPPPSTVIEPSTKFQVIFTVHLKVSVVFHGGRVRTHVMEH